MNQAEDERMPPQGLNPGDGVVDLAALVRTASLVTGAAGAAWVLWLIKRIWLASLGGLIAGAVLGLVVAEVVSRVLYRAADGHPTVVKAGSGALRSTISAGLAGGLATGAVVGALALLLFSATREAASLLCVLLGCGVAFGFIFACVASLL